MATSSPQSPGSASAAGGRKSPRGCGCAGGAPQAPAAPRVDAALVEKTANTIRGLTMDAIGAANSGHPGLPLGMAEAAATLWLYFLKHSPKNPAWPDRDRFVLSAGHGSMLLYSLLHLAGFDVSLDDIKNFRQWDSPTPGHPEFGHTPGVEITTGPLGQGFASGVGMALAAQMLEARFNTPERRIVDHWIYAIVSDGDLMEGVAAEAASFAGHHQLERLIYLYDDNKITIEGSTSLTFSREDVAARFEALGWDVRRVENGRDAQAVAGALAAAQAVAGRPHLIILRTEIGYPSPKVNTPDVHGSPLKPDEIAETKRRMGWPETPFFIPPEVPAAFAARRAECEKAEAAWNALVERFHAKEAQLAALWDSYFAQPLPRTNGEWEALLPDFKPAEKPLATRSASGKTINALAPRLPWLIGGSADLAPSNNTFISGAEPVGPGAMKGRNIHFGIREHAMGAILNGIALHGGFRAYGGTFLVFADYMRPAIRLAALMKLPVIYIFTHDSIFLGEDGPTHQPVETLASLRAIPGLSVIRPADPAETAWAWASALRHKEGPVALVLTRQNLATLDRERLGCPPPSFVAQGGYIARREKGEGGPQLILIATGSELALALEAAARIEEADGTPVRVVNLPCWEWFQRQPASYRDQVLPPACRRRLAIEAASSFGWERWIGLDGRMIGLNRYGASAPAKVLAEKFGFTVENILAQARALAP